MMQNSGKAITIYQMRKQTSAARPRAFTPSKSWQGFEQLESGHSIEKSSATMVSYHYLWLIVLTPLLKQILIM